MSIARNLEHAMIRHDISTARLADISGVSKASINKYLSGAVVPADEIIVKLAEALGEPTDRIKPIPQNKRSGKITVEEAAEMMGKSPQWLREVLKAKELPESFGTARNRTGRRWTYYISPKGFEAYTGIEVSR